MLLHEGKTLKEKFRNITAGFCGSESHTLTKRTVNKYTKPELFHIQ